MKTTYERTRTALQRLKRVRGCAACDKKGLPGYCYDFHHRDPATKLYDISSNMTKRLEDVMEEVKKCDVLCAICHRIAEHEDVSLTGD